MKKDIICPPYAPVLMESTRAIGYSIESAIADVIDNSIAAQAKNIWIYYNYFSSPYIEIIDDGCGMSSETITEAMRYGTCSPTEERSEGDLGRYGLGLKTASLSQCRKLTVISKQKGKSQGRQWDLDHIIKTKEWSLIQLDEKEMEQLPGIDNIKNMESGTIVIWSELDKLKSGSVTISQAIDEKMDSVKEHLELVFHRYLSGKGVTKINIYMNGLKLVAFDPFFEEKSTRPMDDEKIEIPGRDGKVFIRPYVLPHPSRMTNQDLKVYGGKKGLRSLQGFYIYRNKRLITWGTWFNLIRKDEFTKLARVQVDIPNSLDDLWTLDVKKSTAYPPDIVKTRLNQLVGKMSEGSKRSWTFRAKKETADGMIHIWDVTKTREGIKYVVNDDHPILNMLREKMDDDSKKLLKEYLETVQNNLPLNQLHKDLHDDTKLVLDDEEDEKQRVLYIAKQMLVVAIEEDHLEDTLEGFKFVEPFNNYLNEINAMLVEVKHNV